VCARGASALGDLLARYPRARVRVVVVWEPVLESDVGPPAAEARAPLARDARVVELWNPAAWKLPDGRTVWDVVAIYPPGATWSDPFPWPQWYGAPVVRSLGPVEELLRSGRPAASPPSAGAAAAAP
jgi:hypothetical protein